MYNFQILMTGSDGNCSLLTYKGTTILIDAGFKTKAKMEELLTPLLEQKTIDGIIITHEHTDHFSTWTGRLAIELDIPIYLHKRHYEREEERKTKYLSHEDKRAKQTYYAKTIDIKEDEEFTIKDLTIKPFTAYHDASKTLGFIFNEEFGYLSDCGYISNNIKKNLQNVSSLALEFNYDEEKLIFSERHWQNKVRTFGKFGHLSNDEAFKFLNFLLLKGNLKQIITLHQSDLHNSFEILEEKFEKLKKDFDFEYIISERNCNDIVKLQIKKD